MVTQPPIEEIKDSSSSPPNSGRRSDRVQISFSIEAIGTDYQRGQPFCQKGQTVTVSRYGAAISLNYTLAAEQEVTIRCVDTCQEAVARVVGLIYSEGTTFVHGVAFVDAEANPWGIEFPSAGTDEGFGRILLGCHLCQSSKVVHLNEIELQVFEANQSIQQFCKSCSATTSWKRQQNKAHCEPQPKVIKTEELASQRGTEKRKHRRVVMNIPACIRRSGSLEEVVTCDLSRSGIGLRTSKHYEEGALIEVALPYSAGGSGNIFVSARVVHVQRSGRFFKVGIAYSAASGKQQASVYSSGSRSVTDMNDD